MKKHPSESYIVEIPRGSIPYLGQIFHLAKEGGIHQAEMIMKDLATQVEGLYADKAQRHLVYPRTILAPDNAKRFESCLYVELVI